MPKYEYGLNTLGFLIYILLHNEVYIGVYMDALQGNRYSNQLG